MFSGYCSFYICFQRDFLSNKLFEGFNVKYTTAEYRWCNADRVDRCADSLSLLKYKNMYHLVGKLNIGCLMEDCQY